VSTNTLTDQTVTRSDPLASPAPEEQGPERSARWLRVREHLINLALMLGVLIVVLAVWEYLAVSKTVSPYILPKPTGAARALWEGVITKGTYRHDMWVTMKEMLLGFAAGAGTGLVLGALLASSRWVERAFMPYVVFMQTVPLVAVAPLLLIWFGFGITAKVVTVSLLVLFPVTVNTLAGLKATSQSRVDLLQSFGASPRHIFRHVKLPAAAPFIFTGLDIGIVYSPVGAIVSEFLGADHGLGIAIFQAQQNLDLPGVFALVVLLGLIGIALHLILVGIRRRVVYWQRFGTESSSSRG
jgi:NitT/TauT family transport system permease protein